MTNKEFLIKDNKKISFSLINNLINEKENIFKVLQNLNEFAEEFQVFHKFYLEIKLTKDKFFRVFSPKFQNQYL